MIRIIQVTAGFFRSSFSIGVAPLSLTYLLLRSNHSLEYKSAIRIYASCLFLTTSALYYRKLAWKTYCVAALFFLFYFEHKRFAFFNPFIFVCKIQHPVLADMEKAFIQANLCKKAMEEAEQKVFEEAVMIATRDENEGAIAEMQRFAQLVEEGADEVKNLNIKGLEEDLEALALEKHRGLLGELIKEGIKKLQKTYWVKDEALKIERQVLKVQESILEARAAAQEVYKQICEQKKGDLLTLKNKREAIDMYKRDLFMSKAVPVAIAQIGGIQENPSFADDLARSEYFILKNTQNIAQALKNELLALVAKLAVEGKEESLEVAIKQMKEEQLTRFEFEGELEKQELEAVVAKTHNEIRVAKEKAAKFCLNSCLFITDD